MNAPVRPPLLGRALLRLASLGDRADDIRADLEELFERRVATVGPSRAKRRYIADVCSLLTPALTGWSLGVAADLRDASRALRRTPVQTLSMLVCLLLGTSLTVVAFSVVNTVLAGPLPGVAARGELMRVSTVRLDVHGSDYGERDSVSVGAYRALPSRVPGTSGTAFQIPSVFNAASLAGAPVRLRGQFVNGEYFSTLGTQPVVGRLLSSADDRPGAPPVVVVGHDFWTRQMARRPSVVGESIAMGPHVATIVGVAPRGFAGIADIDVGQLGSGGDGSDLWVPTSLATWGRDAMVMGMAGAAGGKVVLRLAPGSTIQDVRRALASAGGAVDAAWHSRFGGFDVEPFALTEEGTDGAELLGGVSLLMAVPILVLSIACTNVAGVQLARSIRRVPELATRVALGATRVQVTRLVVLEIALIAVVAAGGALVAAEGLGRLAEGVLPLTLSIDWRVYAFVTGVSACVTVVAGVWPSWRATGFRVQDAIQAGSGIGASLRVGTTRRVTLVLQVALSAMLLTVGLHLIRAFEAVPDQLAPRLPNVLAVDLRLFDVELTEEEQSAAWARLSEVLPTFPGVDSVAMGSPLFAQENWGAGDVQGRTRAVTANWFGALGIELRAGHIPRAGEDGLVINETLARRLGGTEAALGRVVTANKAQVAVVGVVADSYERVAFNRALPVAYRIVTPGAPGLGGTVLLVGPGAAIARQSLLALLATIHPQLSPWQMGLVSELVDRRFAAGRAAVTVLSWMSVAALVLAGVGVFGAVSQAAAARVREFGLRIALGARHLDIARVIVRDVTSMCVVGLSVGLAMATLIAHVVRSGLETITPGDPVPGGMVAAAVLAIGGVAAAAPVRAVLAIDPVTTLKGDHRLSR